MFDFVFDMEILECVLEVAFWDSFNVLQGALPPEASPAPIVGLSNLFSWTWPHTKPLINMVGALISVFYFEMASQCLSMPHLNTFNIVSARITGRKAVAVKNFLALPNSVQTELLKIVGIYGWDECILNEENMCSKRLAVGASFRSGHTKASSPWYKMSEVTEEVLLLFCKYLLSKSATDSKMSKSEFERSLEQVVNGLM